VDLELLVLGDTGWGDEMLRAASVTLLLSLTAMSIGLFISIFGTLSKLSDKFYVRVIADVYTTIVRGIPELLVIYLLFFGGSNAVMGMAKLFGYHGYIELNAFVIGSVAVGAISGAYSTEVMRGAPDIAPTATDPITKAFSSI
jgi:octopine/nopaline transport system permease protein